jgi:2-oxoglutarate dehydrogenase E1 component
MNDSLREQYASSLLYGGNASYLEALYEQYLREPGSVAPEWRQYFDRVRGNAGAEAPHGPVIESLRQHARRGAGAGQRDELHAANAKQGAVSRLIQAYANRGHLIAKLDPLGLMERPTPKVLELGYFGLSAADLEQEFSTGSRTGAIAPFLKLAAIVEQLRFIYCDTIGAEFAHVSDSVERLWLQDRFQDGRVQHRFTAEEKRNLLWQLSAAEGLERYLHTKYVGQKRFSLEGADSFIPLLDDVIQRMGSTGAQESVIGMAHRGRLNVLVNILGKSPGLLFSEFEGHYDASQTRGSGDVKYHKGFSADLKTPGGNVHVALAFNPSHLEVVDPVVEGSVRARQERCGDELGTLIVPVLVHGDAAFAGQGVVMETLQLSQARGFRTGGTIHIIINNQVGFTTSNPADTRSTQYASDVAKMIEAPIFHVNGDDPEAVTFVGRLAVEYRMQFHKDIVIDLVCYRRHGHNEADEPAATQPLMYKTIRQHPSPRKIYADRLAREGVLSESDAAAMVEEYRRGLDEGKPQARAALGLLGNKYTVDWSRYLHADWHESVRTAVDLDTLRALGRTLTEIPPQFTLHPRVAQVIANRQKMLAGEMPLDWGCAETLAYASLLKEGFPIRLVGQDTARGTFFHRHAVLHDQTSGATYVPLQHVAPGQPRFNVIDSVLSEEAVMGFEYGYSTTDPQTLDVWEGQFGDFANGAQVIIDQFISSGEAKWGRVCGLALFLPHGYEGQGPEHSSARLERFLQLCAESNMQVCVPSTPAQMFHMLRRQMQRALRKPLVVMTPKSLLRHKHSVSELKELTHGRFQNIIEDTAERPVAGARRIVFCSGKVYFDLLEQRDKRELRDVALVRVEQLYPFPTEEYAAIIRRHPNAREIVWCQEEPQNQGAWYQIRHRLQEPLTPKHALLYAGRAPAAAPATGIHEMHEEQQHGLVQAALEATATESSGRETARLKSIAIRKTS